MPRQLKPNRHRTPRVGGRRPATRSGRRQASRADIHIDEQMSNNNLDVEVCGKQ